MYCLFLSICLSVYSSTKTVHSHFDNVATFSKWKSTVCNKIQRIKFCTMHCTLSIYLLGCIMIINNSNKIIFQNSHRGFFFRWKNLVFKSNILLILLSFDWTCFAQKKVSIIYIDTLLFIFSSPLFGFTVTTTAVDIAVSLVGWVDSICHRIVCTKCVLCMHYALWWIASLRWVYVMCLLLCHCRETTLTLKPLPPPIRANYEHKCISRQKKNVSTSASTSSSFQMLVNLYNMN